MLHKAIGLFKIDKRLIGSFVTSKDEARIRYVKGVRNAIRARKTRFEPPAKRLDALFNLAPCGCGGLRLQSRFLEIAQDSPSLLDFKSFTLLAPRWPQTMSVVSDSIVDRCLNMH